MDTGRRLNLCAVALGALAIATPALAGAPDRRAKPATAAPLEGPSAIASANRAALARSEAARFDGGRQVFSFAPGRVYEVWTAPLRVTALSLAPGERVERLAAGDTLRWQIGETVSGDGAARTVHVLVKPFETGLDTNLVLATSRGLYMVRLRSGRAEAANSHVAWTPPPQEDLPPPAETATAPIDPIELLGALDGGYRVTPRGAAKAWAQTTVVTDGLRTYILLPPGAAEGPAFFKLDALGRRQTANYRQSGRLLVVDGVVLRGELRLGEGRRDAVLIEREARKAS